MNNNGKSGGRYRSPVSDASGRSIHQSGWLDYVRRGVLGTIIPHTATPTPASSTFIQPSGTNPLIIASDDLPLPGNQPNLLQ